MSRAEIKRVKRERKARLKREADYAEAQREAVADGGAESLPGKGGDNGVAGAVGADGGGASGVRGIPITANVTTRDHVMVRRAIRGMWPTRRAARVAAANAYSQHVEETTIIDGEFLNATRVLLDMEKANRLVEESRRREARELREQIEFNEKRQAAPGQDMALIPPEEATRELTDTTYLLNEEDTADGP